MAKYHQRRLFLDLCKRRGSEYQVSEDWKKGVLIKLPKESLCAALQKMVCC